MTSHEKILLCLLFLAVLLAGVKVRHDVKVEGVHERPGYIDVIMPGQRENIKAYYINGKWVGIKTW